MERKDFLHLKIDLPSFQFEVYTREPGSALPELRKILEAVQLDDQLLYEEYVVQEMRSSLSEQFIGNQQVMAAVKKLLRQEDDYRVARVEIDKTAMIDLDNRTRDVRIERPHVRRAVTDLTEGIDTEAVKHGIVHISGDIQNDDKLLIVDHIHKTMPTAQLRAFQSDASSPKVIVECVFFGEFPAEED